MYCLNCSITSCRPNGKSFLISEHCCSVVFVGLLKRKHKMTSSLCEATAQFAIDLLRRSGPLSENNFLSPFSITAALGMVFAGTDGNSAAQIREVVFKGVGDDSKIYQGLAEIVILLNEPRNVICCCACGSRDKFEIRTANRLYSHIDAVVLKDFKKTLASCYKSKMLSVDFEHPKTRNDINHWVEHVTCKKIKEIIKPGMLDKCTRVVIVNAIYFKADWAKKFRAEDTKEDKFHTSPDQTKIVEMMRQEADLQYGETDQVQVLVLPYVRDLALYLFLPKENLCLEEFEKQLTGEKLLSLMHSTFKATVEVEMPKFKMEAEFELRDALEAMGMTDIFSEENADFSKMLDCSCNQYYVSKVIHKASVELDEKGTEAAAATVSGHRMMFVKAVESLERVRFIADHPFLFVIADERKKQIVFIGRLRNPEAPPEKC